ncbi:hypothetical protein JSE7799_01864 [Jannaschia seosinensis]|uniref:Cytochrome C oxidase assembly protein n=1 Tax=Jannaschia seosinensis TaxID=313367 RepID=A0A0M7BB55_9RHOB|nr:hypothetical protein [Jannaschia seosinensis]CUH39143.1 hypothetical protein JSE7799_01864 [Jannaschia seosinensis]
MHRDHEIHNRRKGRNFGLLAVLVVFILLIFGVTVVKIRSGGLSEAFDHVLRPSAMGVEDGE